MRLKNINVYSERHKKLRSALEKKKHQLPAHYLTHCLKWNRDSPGCNKLQKVLLGFYSICSMSLLALKNKKGEGTTAKMDLYYVKLRWDYMKKWDLGSKQFIILGDNSYLLSLLDGFGVGSDVEE